MANNELMHYGVLGMKWGRRKDRNRVTTPAHDDYIKAHSKKSVKSMSDAELRSRNNRLQMEKQYADLTRKTSTGKKAVKAIIATATTLAALDTAVNTYSKVGKKVMDQIGGYVMDEIVKGF